MTAAQRDHWVWCEWPEMARQTSLALRRAHALNDRVLTLRAAAGLALAEIERGAIGPATLAADEAHVALARASDTEIADSLEALLCLGLAEVLLERRRVAIKLLERGLAIARASRRSWLAVALATVAAMARLYVGELARADDALDAAVEAAGAAVDERWLSWMRALRCWSLTLRGRVTHVSSAGLETIEAGASGCAPLWACWGRCFLGRALIEAGDPLAGRARILEGGGGPELPLLTPSVRAEWYASLVEADLVLGCADTAEAWALRAEASARSLPTAAAAAWAELARATLAFTRGGFERAAELAVAAGRSFDRVEQVIDTARARTLAARALAASGAIEQPIALLQEACAALDHAGALRYHDEASRQLRRLGARVPAPTSAPAGRVPLGNTAFCAERGRPAVPLNDGGARRPTRKLDAELFRSIFGGGIMPPGPDAPAGRQLPAPRSNRPSAWARSSAWPRP
jgi:hypothetical protein